jgi:hypothetical protein
MSGNKKFDTVPNSANSITENSIIRHFPWFDVLEKIKKIKNTNGIIFIVAVNVINADER